MEYKRPSSSASLISGHKIQPRLIIHGGAGNITPTNLPPSTHNAYVSSLLSILSLTHAYLLSGHSSLDTATFAVSHLENNPLFNSGHGAVFTRDGVNELEASVMVSSGKKKRGVGVMGLRHVKNPIRLAREMLIRGEDDLEGGNGEHRGPMRSMSDVEAQDGEFSGRPPSNGAQGHCQLFGEGAEKLARKWGLEMVEPSYYFVQQRWDEHVRGLEREKNGKGHAFYDTKEYVPQGTCGAVALDADGVVCVATSTGGMTNKLTGRIGDTPTLGAGFWAEEWEVRSKEVMVGSGHAFAFSDSLRAIVADCLPRLSLYTPILTDEFHNRSGTPGHKTVRATAISGTGNGDSFLRLNAVRTASAIARYRNETSLQSAVTEITGPDGELQHSAGKRWKKTGEGEGGMIGIECAMTTDNEGAIDFKSDIVLDYNCGGMFRALVTRDGKVVCRVWRPGQYEGLEKYEREGKEYDVLQCRSEKS